MAPMVASKGARQAAEQCFAAEPNEVVQDDELRHVQLGCEQAGRAVLRQLRQDADLVHQLEQQRILCALSVDATSLSQ